MTAATPNPKPKLIAVPNEADASFDSYALHDPAYSVNEFYLSATAGGFSAKTPRSSVPPAIAARMNEIIQDQRLPYRTMEAFIRDAIYHRLHWLAEEYDMPAGLHPDLNMWAHAAKLGASIERLEANRSYLENLGKGAEAAERVKNYRELARIIATAAEAAEGEDEIHAAQIMAVVYRYQPDVDRWRKAQAE